jgi:hypothetical protein
MSNVPPQNWGGGQWGIGPCGWNASGLQGTTQMVAPKLQIGGSYLNSMQNFGCLFSQGFVGMFNPVMHPSLIFQVPIRQPMLGTVLGIHFTMFEGPVQQIMVTTTIVP